LNIRKEILALEPGIWKKRKLAEVDQLIQDCLGLFIGVKANNYWVSPGQQLTANFELVNRSGVEVVVEKILSTDLALDSTLSLTLKNNVSSVFKTKRNILASKSYSDPYWLKEPHGVGRFTVNDPTLIGRPDNGPSLVISFILKVQGQTLTVERPVDYRWNDPVKGEQARPLEVVPPVFVNLSENVMVFSDDSPREVKVKIKSATDGNLSGTLKLQLPSGWRSEPASIPFVLKTKEEEDTKIFSVYPSKNEINSTMKAFAEIDGKTYDKSLHLISYDHIPVQTLLPNAETKVVRINLKKEGAVIGYIRGAGDDVPTALRTMGYEVWEMNNNEVTLTNLKKVDAVVLGIRAINTNERIRFIMNDLLEYVKQGGTVVVQYNTAGDLETDKFSPYPITLSRERVTEEDSKVRLLKPDHAILNTPNKITEADFDGWVQERGLYFPNKWDENSETIISMNDTGESAKDGSLLVSKYGEGYYIYTGLSFFRELPEGVPGAYKLFANLVSIGKNKKPDSAKVKNKAK
jgi:hypothetical protein